MNKLVNKFFNDISPLFIIGFLVLSSFVVTLNAADEGTEVESVTIIGTKDDVKELPGSGSVGIYLSRILPNDTDQAPQELNKELSEIIDLINCQLS